MRIVLHRNVPEDPVLLGRWNRLVLQMERPEVFYTSEWSLAVQEAYSDSLRPLLFLGYDENELVGVASLATDTSGQHVSFLGATTGDYCEFLTCPERREEFADAVFREIRELAPTTMSLANLPADSATPGALEVAARNHRFHIHTRPAYLCAQIDLGPENARQELKKSLQSKKKLRHHLRAMEREGPVAVAHLQCWEQIQPLLPIFADAHVARFQGMQRVSSLATAKRRNFLGDLARRFSDTGVVTLSLMKVGERPVAWNYGFQFCGSWFWYQPTFDSRYEENSPGHCLLSRIVTQACDMAELDHIDLGLGAEGYKDRYANNRRQTLHVSAMSTWSRHVRDVVRYRMAGWLTRSPKLDAAIRGVLRRPRTPGEQN